MNPRDSFIIVVGFLQPIIVIQFLFHGFFFSFSFLPKLLIPDAVLPGRKNASIFMN